MIDFTYNSIILTDYKSRRKTTSLRSVSLALALVFHYTLNKEIDGSVRYVKPELKIIRQIYKLGFPAFLMQAMLSVMMFGILLIIGTIDDTYTVNLLSGSYGIYYKLMQAALFACFGLSNTLISIISFNYGMKDKVRVKDTIKHGSIAAVTVALLLTAIYQLFASDISSLFALTLEENSIVAKSDVIASCKTALHVAASGYAFMGFSVAVQGILQGFGEVYSPLIISVLRLLFPVLPIAFLFTLSPNVSTLIWWSFPISELITAVAAFIFLKAAIRRKVNIL